MYRLYRNQASAAYSLHYFFIFLSLQLSNIKIFITFFSGTVRSRRLKLVHTWTVGRCIMYTRIRLLLLIHPFISSFFFLSNFQHWNNSSHFSRELWGLEDWKLVHAWTVGRCIMYTRIRLLLFFHPFISSFFFLSNFQHRNFSSHFSRELWGLEDWKLVHAWTVGRYKIFPIFRLLLLIHPFSHFSFSPIFNIKIFRHTFLGNCEA